MTKIAHFLQAFPNDALICHDNPATKAVVVLYHPTGCGSWSVSSRFCNSSRSEEILMLKEALRLAEANITIEGDEL